AATILFASKRQVPARIIPKLPEPLRQEVATPEVISVTNEVKQNILVTWDWSKIESTNWLEYAENLRRVRCPEATVRDILSADINQYFVRQRQEILRPWQALFWDRAAQGGDSLFDEATKKKVEELEKEKEKWLAKVKAGDAKDEETFHLNPAEMTDFLSADKLQKMQELEKNFSTKYNLSEQKETPSGNEELAEEQLAKRRKEAEQEREEKIKALLSVEEYAEFNLRKSQSANTVRYLRGFSASEDELRELARLEPETTDLPDEANSPAKQAKIVARQIKEGKIKALLGDERFAEFTRARDGDFQSIYRVTQRYGLPQDSANHAFQIFQEARQQEKTLRQSRDLSNEQRGDLLEAIEIKTRNELSRVLGERAADTYRRNGGDWVSKLSE
ncbi:MAG: hypothetical protein ABJC04_02735, partial [Verrucomicrobiota bacterium]